MKKILLSLVALFITSMAFAVERITVKEFLEKADPETTYELTGLVKTIKNTTYGNFYLEQEGSEIYVYGVVNAEGTTKIWSSLGINEGDSIVIQGAYFDYNGTAEIKNALYISHKANGTTVVDISNTPETAYSVTKALELITAGEGLSTNVYVKGTVLPDGLSISTSYGNADYNISDGTNSIKVYRGYYLENKKFTSEDQLQDGDEVIVYGQLMDYQGTPEIGSGNYIYSLNGKTTADTEEEPTEPTIGGVDTFENGGFETWVSDSEPKGWKSTTTASNATLEKSTDARTGSYSVCVKNATSNKRLGSKEFKLAAGSYKFSFYAKSATETLAEARPGYAPWDAANNKLGSYSYGSYTELLSNTEWTLVTYEFELAEETQINLVVMNPKSTDSATYGDLLIDDATLVAVGTGINAVNANATANNAIYNVAGQRVSENYKGIVVKNGKKYFVK